ncbi:Signal recognition particle 9 kDa protein-domain-containing protein [Madurella fahalii]|uniref:Signal recognition particle 9 kDa protein-domain-containing protein n=1 Tax=Madurella fahalii TaxID=1157608 RepID=A0ABQ0GSX9_9PEZI
MPYYEKSEDWLHQSSLLLQARPATTRITTRYHLKPARRPTKAEKKAAAAASKGGASARTPQQPAAQQQQQQQQQQQSNPPKPPRGHLVLKTYDAATGATLKYKTSKAAEVGRLVQMLGSMGRRMAGVAPAPAHEPSGAAQEDAVMGDAGPAVVEAGGGEGPSGSGVQTPTATATTTAGQGQGQAQAQGGGGGAGGGKGKKKKGKK